MLRGWALGRDMADSFSCQKAIQCCGDPCLNKLIGFVWSRNEILSQVEKLHGIQELRCRIDIEVLIEFARVYPFVYKQTKIDQGIISYFIVMVSFWIERNYGGIELDNLQNLAVLP
ncbi:MAG TPA: hypothetical protein PLT87_07770 [Spirochaetales bacterium]|nr:hypothetical protein [Spirochaetales bacterium]